MSTQVSSCNRVFIYDTVTGLPITTEIFDDRDKAEAFIDWIEEHSQVDIRTLTENHLQTWRKRFEAYWAEKESGAVSSVG